MEHNPEVEFTCDGVGCTISVFLEMTQVVGGYSLSDSDSKYHLWHDHGFLTTCGNHFCSQQCAESAGYGDDWQRRLSEDE